MAASPWMKSPADQAKSNLDSGLPTDSWLKSISTAIDMARPSTPMANPPKDPNAAKAVQKLGSKAQAGYRKIAQRVGGGGNLGGSAADIEASARTTSPQDAAAFAEAQAPINTALRMTPGTLQNAMALWDKDHPGASQAARDKVKYHIQAQQNADESSNDVLDKIGGGGRPGEFSDETGQQATQAYQDIQDGDLLGKAQGLASLFGAGAKGSMESGLSSLNFGANVTDKAVNAMPVVGGYEDNTPRNRALQEAKDQMGHMDPLGLGLFYKVVANMDIRQMPNFIASLTSKGGQGASAQGADIGEKFSKAARGDPEAMADIAAMAAPFVIGGALHGGGLFEGRGVDAPRTIDSSTKGAHLRGVDADSVEAPKAGETAASPSNPPLVPSAAKGMTAAAIAERAPAAEPGKLEPYKPAVKPSTEKGAYAQAKTEQTAGEAIVPPDEPVQPPAKVAESTDAHAPQLEEPVKPESTGLANQVNAREADAYGLPMPEKGKFRNKVEALTEGKRRVEAGEIDPLALADEIGKNPRVPNAEEFGALTEGKRRLLNAREKAYSEFEAAGKPDAGPLRTAWEEADAKLQKFSDDVQKGKTEWASAGNALQAGIDVENGTFAEVIDQAERHGKVTARDRKVVSEAIAQRDAAHARIAELEDQMSAARAGDAVNREAKRGSRQAKVEDIRARRADLVARMKEITRESMGKANDLGSVAYDALRKSGLGIQYMKTLVEEGIVRLPEIVERFRKEVHPELTDRQAHDLISGYGNKTEAKSPSELTRQIIDLKKQASLHSRIEDAASGKAHPKDARNTMASPEVAALKAELADERQKAGLKEKLDAEAEGTPPKAERAAGRTPSDEAKDLMDQLRERRRINKVNDSIAKIQDQLDRGEPNVKSSSTKALSAELEKALQKRDAAGKQLRQLVDSKRSRTWAEHLRTLHGSAVISTLPVYGKLAGASVAHLPVEGMADWLGVGFGKLRVKGEALGDVAAREGRVSLSGIKGRKMFSREALENARQSITRGFNDLDARAGKANEFRDVSKYNPLKYIGRSHGAIKSFLQTGEFHKALELRLAKAAEKGIDITDPEVHEKIGFAAALDAQEAILKKDNPVAQWMESTLQRAERFKAKDAGPVGRMENLGVQAVGALFRSAVPVLKIPLNFLSYLGDVSGGGLIRGGVLHAMAHFGEHELTPALADEILKAYKRGGLGLGTAAIGLGGFAWCQTLANGDMVIFGRHIDRKYTHTPFLAAIKFWSAVREGVTKGDALAPAREIGHEVPGLETAADVGGALTSTDKRGQKAFGYYLKSFIPLRQPIEAVYGHFVPDEQGELSTLAKKAKAADSGEGPALTKDEMDRLVDLQKAHPGPPRKDGELSSTSKEFHRRGLTREGLPLKSTGSNKYRSSREKSYSGSRSRYR